MWPPGSTVPPVDPPSEQRPLCVDLDGTLVATDLLWEALFLLVRRRPWILVVAPFWLMRGRSGFKRRLASRARDLDVTRLPYREDVVAFVRVAHRCGRPVVLTTAADETVASAVAAHLGTFTAVLASDGQRNLKGRTKARELVQRFGAARFDYIGDSRADIPVWNAAATAWAPSHVRIRGVPQLQRIGESRPLPYSRSRALVRALRPHQWLKNVLLVVAPIAAHRLDWTTALQVGLALVTLSLCASGGYILNDLLDMEADRQHPRKRHRPFAAGDLSPATGGLVWLTAWVVGLGTAALFLPRAFLLALVAYLMTSMLYSIRLKRMAVLDVMVLAGLYVVRVVAGGLATGVPVSSWLLAFTLFMSLGFAFLKRFVEVSAHRGGPSERVPGRDYQPDDAGWLHSVGLTCGYLAVLVLALYVNSVDVTRLYTHPERLLLVCPVLLYWTTRTWFKAHRHALHDDPVVAVALDPVTYVVLAMSGAAFVAAM